MFLHSGSRFPRAIVGRALAWWAVLLLLALLPAVVMARVPAASTSFTRDPALLRAKEAQVVEVMRKKAPAAASGFEALFAQDLLTVLGPELRRMGLDDQDMADMTAVYWVKAWEAVNGIYQRQTDPALVRGVRDQIAGVFADNAELVKMIDRDKQDIADTMFLQTVLVEARMDGAARSGADAQRQMGDTIRKEALDLIDVDLRKMQLTAAGFVPAESPVQPKGEAAAPSADAASLAPAAHADNWSRVEGVYFRSYTSFGVGGMITSDYTPVVLFRDGSYYEVEGDALEDMDLAASRRAHPAKWGRWSKSGGGYTFINSGGHATQTTLQGGSFFKAFPAEAAGGKLAARYSRLSGGGNSAMGGGMTIAMQTDLGFTADGRYMQGSSMGAVGSGSGVATSAASHSHTGVGHYRINRHTITFTEPDGHTRRQFFALGSRKTPPQPDASMIFLGDRVFVTER